MRSLAYPCGFDTGFHGAGSVLLIARAWEGGGRPKVGVGGSDPQATPLKQVFVDWVAPEIPRVLAPETSMSLCKRRREQWGARLGYLRRASCRNAPCLHLHIFKMETIIRVRIKCILNPAEVAVDLRDTNTFLKIMSHISLITSRW